MKIYKRLTHLILWGTCVLLPFKTFSLELARDQNSVVKDQVNTWIESDLAKRPVSIGVRIPAKIINSPTSESLVAMIPQKANIPFKHIFLQWEIHGHDPIGIYNVPHFDIHFYLLSNEVRKAITCAGADNVICMKPVPTNAVPSDYGPTPQGVPQMGWHWVDLLAPEFHSEPFTATMVYGYYNGQLAFLEPMVTQAFFQSRQPFKAPIRQPLNFPVSGYYPTSYTISYDTVADTYAVELTDMVYRK